MTFGMDKFYSSKYKNKNVLEGAQVNRADKDIKNKLMIVGIATVLCPHMHLKC